MLSLHRARDLLANASTLDDLAAVARLLGIAGAAREMDDATREALGIPPEIVSVRIGRGPGCTRALLLDIGPCPLRDTLTSIASRLSTRAPQLLWLLLAIDTDRAHVAVAAFTSERHPPRTRALLCQRDNVLDSDAETLCALASARGGVDVMLHYRWTEILGREALTRRFYLTLERVVDTLASSTTRSTKPDARELALLYVSRLLFLSFLETQGWLNGDHVFLANGYADCMARGGRYHTRVLLPLFFGTLNTPPRCRSARARAFGRIPFLNGGLFSRSAVERRTRKVEFSDEAMGVAFGDLFCRHRFTPREDSTEWSEAAVDPEMLGKAFESLMGSRDRKSSGAFYTPQPIVERVLHEALAHALKTPAMPEDEIRTCLAARAVPLAKRADLLARVRSVRLLDPACGSGAFLVFALKELSWLSVACGDERSHGDITRAVLASAIFGVDVNPMAVWLCELRLWLTMVMEQREQGIGAITPLPNLDRQIRVGDTLTGGTFGAKEIARGAGTAKLRLRYSGAHGSRKKALGRALDRAERALALRAAAREIEAINGERRELLIAARTRDFFGERHRASADTRRALQEVRASLRELRAMKRDLESGSALPFCFQVQFAEIAAAGGFGIVVGNPPWVRPHRVPARQRARLRAEYEVFRSPTWRAGANGAGAGSGFGTQVDMSALFVERSLQLLRPDGVVALLLPAKLWSSLAGAGVRSLIHRHAAMLTLEDFSNAPVAFDAAVYPSLLVARKTLPSAAASPAHFAVHGRRTVFAWTIPRERIALDDTSGSPWILVPPEVRAALDKLRLAGVPLGDTRIGRPLLGVKSGCNEAFIVTVTDDAGSSATIRSGGRTATIERAMLRPVVKGEHLAAWRCAPTSERVLWTHGADGRALKVLPAECARWLGTFRAQLEARTDGRASDRWWSLFRTEGALSDRPRVVWADIGKRPRAAVLRAGDHAVPLNTCYVVSCREEAEAWSLAAILNSDLAAAWLNVVAEPARGGYHRYLAWTMSLLPLPRDWTSACASLPRVARDVVDGRADSTTLLDAVLSSYGVRFVDVAPLLAWSE